MDAPALIDDLDVDLTDIDNIPTDNIQLPDILSADAPKKTHESFIPRPATLLNNLQEHEKIDYSNKLTKDRRVQVVEDKLREKFKDVGSDADIMELHNSTKDRRKFAERLEDDPKFRQKYLKNEDKKRRIKLDKLIADISNPQDESEPLPTDSDRPHESAADNSSGIEPPAGYGMATEWPAGDTPNLFNNVQNTAPSKTGILIQHVESLVINIYL
jgi:hypothetical protein